MDTESGPTPAQSVASTIERLSSPDWPVRVEAVTALHALIEGGLDVRERRRVRTELLHLLADGSWKVRQALASALGSLPSSREIREALQTLSADGNRYVRETATRALRQKQASPRSPVVHKQDPVFQGIRAEIKRISPSSISESALYDAAERIVDVVYRAVAADATHELNTVLAAVDGFASQLSRRFEALGIADDAAVHFMAKLQERSRFARRIVEDLQWYAAPGAEILEEISAETLLREAATLAQERASQPEPPAHLRFGSLPEVRIAVGRSQMVRALSNIICNALEASPVTLVALSVEINPGEVCFAIEDDGCGMTESQQTDAIRCFSTNKRARGGTGMGLAIAWRVIERDHRGRLEISSAEDEGTCVRVVLPLAQGAP